MAGRVVATVGSTRPPREPRTGECHPPATLPSRPRPRGAGPPSPPRSVAVLSPYLEPRMLSARSVAPAHGTSTAPALLTGATAGDYASTLHAVVDDVAARVAAVTQPWSGASRAHLAELVDAVDLD